MPHPRLHLPAVRLSLLGLGLLPLAACAPSMTASAPAPAPAAPAPAVTPPAAPATPATPPPATTTAPLVITPPAAPAPAPTPPRLATTPPTPASKTYRNAKYKLSFTYPGTWTMREGFAGTVVFVASPQRGSFKPNVNVVAQPVAKNATLESLYQATVASLADSITDFKTTPGRSLTVAGQPAREAVFTGRQGQYDLRWRQLLFIKTGQAYAVTYTRAASDPGTDAQAEAIIQSLRVE